MVIVTHESYDSVLVGTGKQKVLSRCMKTASDGTDATWRGRSFQGAKRYWLPMSAYFFYNNISIIIMISYINYDQLLERGRNIPSELVSVRRLTVGPQEPSTNFALMLTLYSVCGISWLNVQLVCSLATVNVLRASTSVSSMPLSTSWNLRTPSYDTWPPHTSLRHVTVASRDRRVTWPSRHVTSQPVLVFFWHFFEQTMQF